ncbi:MAG: indolepyruvate oxidoreductase [Aestuariibacter sp.]|nr:indolepyruvate oxidoreductase [Aestuariibacter sp.]
MEQKIIISGLGGQGVVFLTRLLTKTAVSLGQPALVSESHGMSRRGGAVISHLRIGGSEAPLIRRGTADLLIALEESEAISNFTFLRQGGVAFVNTPNSLPPKLMVQLNQLDITVHCLSASQIALDLGAVAITNVVMAGFAHPFPFQAMRDAIVALASRRADLNLQALDAGYKESTHATI